MAYSTDTTEIVSYLHSALSQFSHFFANISDNLASMFASVSASIGQSPSFVLSAFFYALIGGVFPALIWLWFWMHESHEHHEPKQTIWITFVAGMCCVFIVYPLQKLTSFLPASMRGTGISETVGSLPVLIIWAFFEELVKFGAAYFVALKDRINVFDEPIDAFIYLMTAALGFSAMENTFFLLSPLLQGDTVISILTGNMRFMGANLLHVASSGVLSLFISLAYFKREWIRKIFTVTGILVATLLHACFNLLIILITETAKEKIFIAFSLVWISIILLILSLERVKSIKEF